MTPLDTGVSDVACHSRADHLTPAGPGGWSFWRALECRTAGFPASLALSLADSDCGRRADALVVARSDARRRVDEVRAGLKSRIRCALAKDADPAVRDSLPALRIAAKALDKRRFDDDGLKSALEPGVMRALRQEFLDLRAREKDYCETYARAKRSAASARR